MIKLIASDLDGTILQHGNHSVSKEFIDTVDQLIRKGIYFVAASGRTYKNINLLFQDATEPLLIISENGGMYSLDNTIYIPKLHSRETVQSLVDTVRQDPSCHLTYACEHTTYVESTDLDFVKRLRDVIRYDITVVDDILEVEDLPIKLSVYNPKGIAYSEHKYKDLLRDQVNVITSGNLWLDFMPYGANKGLALQHIAESLHIRPEECVAFGDQWNDIEMLSFVGTSYAMKNAASGIAELCTHTTDSVLKELQKFL